MTTTGNHSSEVLEVKQVTYSSPEVLETLTGFDEIAMEKAFGYSIDGLADRSTTLLRALLFVLLRREGMTDGEAYKTAMSKTFGELQAMFEDAEEDADLPGSEAGKDNG